MNYLNLKLSNYIKYMMIDNIQYIEDFKNNIISIREDQFKEFDFHYEEKVLEKKQINENLMDFKNYQVNLKKKATIEKMKPGNAAKKEYEASYGVDILEDDIFNNNQNDILTDEEKLDIDQMDKEKKLITIFEYIKRKNILLEEEEIKKIEDFVEKEPNIKKFFNISKTYQQVTRISFIKKLENGSYVIDFNDNKVKKSKKFFLNK